MCATPGAAVTADFLASFTPLLLFAWLGCRSQYAQLQHLLSAQHKELRFVHHTVTGVRQQLQPLAQSLSNLAAGISAGQSGLAAVDVEVDRLVFTLRNSDQKVSCGVSLGCSMWMFCRICIDPALPVTLERH